MWSRLQATYSTQCTQLASRLSIFTTVTTGQKRIGCENAVWPPDDGRKDARNMLRNYWLPIKSLIVVSSWSRLYLLIKDARSFEYKELSVSYNFMNVTEWCLFRQYYLYVDIQVQDNINSYVSLKSRINYEMLYSKFNKFRNQVFLHILNETFPRVSEYNLDITWT